MLMLFRYKLLAIDADSLGSLNILFNQSEDGSMNQGYFNLFVLCFLSSLSRVLVGPSDGIFLWDILLYFFSRVSTAFSQMSRKSGEQLLSSLLLLLLSLGKSPSPPEPSLILIIIFRIGSQIRRKLHIVLICRQPQDRQYDRLPRCVYQEAGYIYLF